MELCNKLSLADWLSCKAKTFNVWHYTQTVRPNLFISATLRGTIDFYHSISLSVTLTLPQGHKVSAKQNHGVHFLKHFSSDQDEICGDEAIQAEHQKTTLSFKGSRSEWCISSMIYRRDTPFWSETLGLLKQGIKTAVLQIVSKNF